MNARSGHRDFGELAGAAPTAYRGGLYDEDSIVGSVVAGRTFVSPGPASGGLRTVANKNASGFNLRGVAEVLAEAGLNPTEELVRVLTERRVITDRNGNAVVGPDGQPMTEPIIDHVLRTKVLMELQQFVAPKLKAVEVTVREPELSEEQIDQRIAALQQKQARAAIHG